MGDGLFRARKRSGQSQEQKGNGMTDVVLKEADGEYSLYETGYGEIRVRDVHLREGQLPDYLPVPDLWDEFYRSHPRTGQEAQELFLGYMRAVGVTNITEIEFCPSCDRAFWNEDLDTNTREDGYVCETCARHNYQRCADCEDMLRIRTLMEYGRTVFNGGLVCESCIESHYSYCEDCDGWYADVDADEHDHDEDGDGCCASPQLRFTVASASGTPLTSDTRTTVTLPSLIGATGLREIRYLLANQPGLYDLAYYAMDEVSPEWQTREGNFPKRLSKLAYQTCKVKVPPEILARVGDIARAHSTGADLEIEFTRRLNRSSADFGNEGSCWWGTYRESRCALKSNGGFGMRSFRDGCVSGRAWVMPLRKNERDRLTPTFDTNTPDAFIVFNGYGELSGYQPARIMADLTGWAYSKIDFSCEPMYVNSGGYLVASEKVLKEPKVTGGLYLSVAAHSDLYQTESQKELANVA